jgi:hypothetical protein
MKKYVQVLYESVSHFMPLTILHKAVSSFELVTTRDTETGDPARMPAQIADRWGLISEKCSLRKHYCTGLTRAAKAQQKYVITARRAQPNN